MTATNSLILYAVIIIIIVIIFYFLISSHLKFKDKNATLTNHEKTTPITEDNCENPSQHPEDDNITIINDHDNVNETNREYRRNDVIIKDTQIRCTGQGRIFEISSKTDPSSKYSVCFDQNISSPYWTTHSTQVKKNHQRSPPNRSFRKDLYGISKQIGDQLYRDFKKITGFPIDRGHCTPYADFSTTQGKNTTNSLMNQAPQFEKLNKGDWSTLERQLRNKRRSFRNVTGISGIIAYLTDYVYCANCGSRIPIPEHFYKLVFNESATEGVAFVGINNGQTKEEYKKNNSGKLLCPDICNEINLFNVGSSIFEDESRLYCCGVNVFMENAKIDGLFLEEDGIDVKNIGLLKF